MIKNGRKILILKYIILDLFTAFVSWICFYYFIKTFIENIEFTVDKNFYIGLIVVPIFWMTLYTIVGTYKKVYKKHRIKEISQTLFLSISGNIFLFFILLLDDEIKQYQDYYTSFSALLFLHSLITLVPRFILTSSTVKKVHNKELGFSTLIVGGNENALTIYNEINNIRNYPGYLFKGFISTNGVDKALMATPIKYFGDYSNLKSTIIKEEIEEVILAIEASEHENINKIINDLAGLNVNIKVIPDMYNILTGSVKMTSIFGALLIEINPEIMPAWQKSIKRILDVFISLIAIIILLPVYIFLIITIKLSSKGPIVFCQERIGINGNPFTIYKFRSMISNAEKNGPLLSSANDTRITPIGKFMRKTRLDEIPQFINVIKSDMSIVGPRPERQFYIDQIMVKAPHYKHLTKVKPGITSWGQVKFGYAENVSQMISRLKYDVLYVENMSLMLDFKIMFYTLIIILKRSGK